MISTCIHRFAGGFTFVLTGLLTVAAVAQPRVRVSPTTQPGGVSAPSGSSYALPNNYFGAHLLVGDGKPGSRGYRHLRWARHLVGRWGYAKTLFMNVDRQTQRPEPGWVDYINTCYQLELIPLIRLGGRMKNGQWLPPEPDAPGDYTSMAAAVRRVVEGFPRSDMCPLYIELWNEPNLNVEWAGRPNPKEYADFFVQAATAIRTIEDPRIRILNGGLATSPEWAEALCRANPEFIQSFDVWASHPYPQSHPPSVNFHDKTARPGTHLTIDSYLLELDVLRRLGRPDVRVMLTETGYDLGNSANASYPIIDEYNRADYIVRAFRDYWSKWPEVAAVFPFEFCNEGWERFDWVYPDSDMNEDGSPTRPHYQYTVVAALAKPTDTTGAINGTVTVAKLGSRLEGAKVSVHLQQMAALSDSMGNYFLPAMRPGKYRLFISKPGFAEVQQKVEVKRGENTVFDVALTAEELGSLHGVVRGGDDDKPLDHVEITLEPGEHSTTTDRRGRYEIKDVIPGRYTLKARAKGRHAYDARDVEVRADRESEHSFVLGERQAPDGENLLSNGGIEAGGGGGAKPGVALGFEPLRPPPPEYRQGSTRISDRFVHTGRSSQEMDVRPDELIIRQITHYNTARPGTTYVAGAWVRIDTSDRDGQAWISLDATRNDGSVIHRIESKTRAAGRSREWIWLSASATAPAGAERLSLNLHTRGRSGSAWFDDVYLGVVKER